MLTYQLLTGGFPFWDNVQNLTLQQARALYSYPTLYPDAAAGARPRARAAPLEPRVSEVLACH